MLSCCPVCSFQTYLSSLPCWASPADSAVYRLERQCEMYRSLTVSAGKTSRQQAASTSPLRLKTVSELARVHSHQPSKENPLAFELGTVNELLSLWEALSDRLKLPLSCLVLNVVGSLCVTDERLPTIVKEVREKSRLSLHVYPTVAQLIK